ncbi:MAG: CocE/NonD family hydrolase, partial [Chlamydiia bacterium]|nr:CocE/NonD family hydrolase [Chlamydiia bacterium]
MNGYCFLVLISTFSLFAVEPTLTVNIPMRDGTKLPADLYFPPNQQEQLPCILVRSPAGRQAEPAKQYIPFANKGYLVVIQETRSSLDSEGKTLPYISDGWGEQQDGYDTVEWLAHVPYTNGRVGTLGPSALGMAQMMLAPTAPPSLKCQYICNAAPSLYHYAIFAGGQFLQHQVEGWLSLYARDPLVLNTIANQPYYNDFWQQFNTLAQANKVSTPAVHEGGWYDMFVQGTIDGFCAWQHEGGEGARKQQKLIIGPWSHFWPYHRKIGDYLVPHNGEKPPIPLSMESWLAHHLKGEPLDLDTIPPITSYVMGPFDGSPSGGNIWRHADSWPLPYRETPLYLCRDRSLNFLSTPKKNLSICYLHDPNNPVPTHGGRNLFIESGPLDQRMIEERDDVIVFTSPPLEEEIEITGRI